MDDEIFHRSRGGREQREKNTLEEALEECEDKPTYFGLKFNRESLEDKARTLSEQNNAQDSILY